jgi:hypothetical protein
MVAYIRTVYTAKNDQVVTILMKTGLNNVVWPTLFTVANNVELYIVTPDTGSTILFNIVDKCEQCGPHNPVKLQAHNFYACIPLNY